MKKSEKFANLVLGCGLLLCVVVLIYALFLSVLPLLDRVKYVIAAIAGMLLLALAFRGRPETKVNFALAVLSFAFTLYLLEILILFGWVELVELSWAEKLLNEQISVALQPGVPFDRRSKRQVVTDLRTKGVDASPSVIPQHFTSLNGLLLGQERLYPLAGLSNKPAVVCNEIGEWVIFENDEHRFNNPKGMYQNQELEMVLIGDSFTYGECVTPGEDIGGLLREGSRDVLNLGIQGHGPLEELATLKEYGEPFNPKLVLWIYYEGNDLLDLLREIESPLLLQYLEPEFSQELIGKLSKIDKYLRYYIEVEKEKAIASEREKRKPFTVILRNWDRILKLFYLRQTVYEFVNPYNEALRFDCTPRLPLFGEILAEGNERVRSWGGEFYFVYLPAWERVSGVVQRENLHCRDNVLRLVEALEIPLIDFHQILSTHPDPLSLFPLRLNGHYTAEGYQLLAQQIET
jgi:hypothetical protein